MVPNSPRSTSRLNRWSPACPTPSNIEIKAAITACRSLTLQQFAAIDATTFCQQGHPDFSPVGWHLGHIGYTEAKWVLVQMAGQAPPFPEYDRLFAADGLPKAERQNLPDLATIVDYLQIVRSQVFDYFDQDHAAAIAAVERQRLWQFLLQHESQHCETVAIVLAIIGSVLPEPHLPLDHTNPAMITIPAGQFWQGNDRLEALDNERPVHRVEVASFAIDRAPVTNAAYQQFINAGGYTDRRWWCDAGWDWLQQNPVTQPYYWPQVVAAHQPVCGVSWYEAQAYAQFVGKRLPTEMEWEAAATELTGIGQVWEWTDSWFAGYPGFQAFPYQGYSATYFDRQHRVLRGGSWATRSWATRPSFRNWYHPGTRVIFAGFRCAQGEAPSKTSNDRQ
jgi:gamma-glutamyl hercynylcysteine S-oxide synthase